MGDASKFRRFDAMLDKLVAAIVALGPDSVCTGQGQPAERLPCDCR